MGDLKEVDSHDILEEPTYMSLSPETNKSSALKTTKSVLDFFKYNRLGSTSAFN